MERPPKSFSKHEVILGVVATGLQTQYPIVNGADQILIRGIIHRNGTAVFLHFRLQRGFAKTLRRILRIGHLNQGRSELPSVCEPSKEQDVVPPRQSARRAGERRDGLALLLYWATGLHHAKLIHLRFAELAE